MKRLLLLFALFIAIPSFAQIEEEILRYSQIEEEIQEKSKEVKINEARSYLYEKFVEEDFDKVKEIKEYLLSLETPGFHAFSGREFWCLLLCTQEYAELLANIRLTGTKNPHTAYEFYPNRSFPPLENCMMEYIEKEGAFMKINIQETELKNVEKSFLSLFVDWITDEVVFSGSLNPKSDAFLEAYPDSDYEWFVRHNIRQVYVKNDWGLGIGVDFRSGFTSGGLPDDGLGMGLSLDVFYMKFDLTLGAGVMTLKTTRDQLYSYGSETNLIFSKGEKCNWVMPYANLAYYLYDGKRVSLGPFVGIGEISEIYPFNKETEEEYKDLEKNFLLYKAGLNIDIKTDVDHSPYIDVRIKYEFGLTGYNQGQVSVVHLISVGLSGFHRGTKRVY